MRYEAENGVERRGLARAVGTYQSKDAALFHAQIHTVQRNRCAERLMQSTCFYACHGFSALLYGDSTRRVSPAHHRALRLSTIRHSTRQVFRVSRPQMTVRLRRSVVLSLSGRAAEWWRGPWAILRQETSAVRPPAANC